MSGGVPGQDTHLPSGSMRVHRSPPRAVPLSPGRLQQVTAAQEFLPVKPALVQKSKIARWAIRVYLQSFINKLLKAASAKTAFRVALTWWLSWVWGGKSGKTTGRFYPAIFINMGCLSGQRTLSVLLARVLDYSVKPEVPRGWVASWHRGMTSLRAARSPAACGTVKTHRPARRRAQPSFCAGLASLWSCSKESSSFVTSYFSFCPR